MSCKYLLPILTSFPFSRWKKTFMGKNLILMKSNLYVSIFFFSQWSLPLQGLIFTNIWMAFFFFLFYLLNTFLIDSHLCYVATHAGVHKLSSLLGDLSVYTTPHLILTFYESCYPIGQVPGHSFLEVTSCSWPLTHPYKI